MLGNIIQLREDHEPSNINMYFGGFSLRTYRNRKLRFRKLMIFVAAISFIFLSTECIFKTVTLTMLEPDEGGEVQPLPGNHKYLINTSVDIQAMPDDGWDFDRWEVDEEFYSNEKETKLEMDSEKTIKAFFSRQLVTLTMEDEEGEGSISPVPGEYQFNYSTVVGLTATPTEGWEFDRWQVNGAFYSSEEETELSMDADKIVKAFFNEEPMASVTLSILEPIGQGSVDPAVGDHKYDAGKSVTLQATPAEGWLFEHWLVEDAVYSTEHEAELTMNTDRNVKAVFVRKTHTLTMLEPSGSGNVEPAVGISIYKEGSVVTLVATPSNGWDFDFWQIDGALFSCNSQITITMNASKTAKAFFVEEPPTVFTLTVVEPIGQGSVSPPVGDHTYIEGTSVPLSATPADGWEFEAWYLDGTFYSDSETTSIIMDRDKSVSAEFVQKAEKVTLEIYKYGRGTVSPPEGTYVYDKGSSVDLSATPDSGYHFEEWLVDGTTYEVPEITITLEWDTIAQAVFRCNCGGSCEK